MLLDFERRNFEKYRALKLKEETTPTLKSADSDLKIVATYNGDAPKDKDSDLKIVATYNGDAPKDNKPARRSEIMGKDVINAQRHIADKFGLKVLKVGDKFLLSDRASGNLVKEFGITPKPFSALKKYLNDLKIKAAESEIKKAAEVPAEKAPELPAVQEQLSLKFDNAPQVPFGTRFVMCGEVILCLDGVRQIEKDGFYISFEFEYASTIGDKDVKWNRRYLSPFNYKPDEVEMGKFCKKRDEMFEKLVAGIAAGKYFVSLD